MSMPTPVTRAARHPHPVAGWWHHEAACNWLALGLLLGAWNAVDDGAALPRRPAPLRGYEAVSVRALHRTNARSARRDGHNIVTVL